MDIETETLPPVMALALDASFGSVERWQEAVRALARTNADAPGLLRLVLLSADGTLALLWQPPGAPLPAGAIELMTLHGAAGQAPSSIDWDGVLQRYRQAAAAASVGLGVAASEAAGAQLLDVRRAGAFEQAATLIEGATWHDPAQVANWAGRLPRDAPVVVYCVLGHEVSQAAALRLRAAGIDARYLEGGIEAWQAQGLPVVPIPGR